MPLSLFDTEGTWRRLGGGLVYDWSSRPEYIPNNLEVPFTFGPHYNWGMPGEERDEFVTRYGIREIFEVVEVFRDPLNDVDPTFKGRHFNIARFDSDTRAVFFRLSMDL